MTNVVRLIQTDDRKALEVLHGMLAYVQRELGELKTSLPDLTAAVGDAVQLSNEILSEAGKDAKLLRRRVRFVPE
jgi:hypothetical protein